MDIPKGALAPIEREVEAWAVINVQGVKCGVSTTDSLAKKMAFERDIALPQDAPHTVLRLSGMWRG